jgi:hypothetical protein
MSVGKPERKRALERPRRKWISYVEHGGGGVEPIQLSQEVQEVLLDFLTLERWNR